MKNPEFVLSVLLAIGTAFVIAVFVPDTHMDGTAKVKLAIAYAVLVILFLFAFLILAAIASGKIDISQLLEEKGPIGKNAGASMGRFQLLIFTFVIGFSFFLVVLCKCDIPQIPANVLALLGVSATTYGVGKGIQATTHDKGDGQGGDADGGGGGGGGPADH
jgi:quinol-cytochrome oxidoreductase complex cytochrome b subunit